MRAVSLQLLPFSWLKGMRFKNLVSLLHWQTHGYCFNFFVCPSNISLKPFAQKIIKAGRITQLPSYHLCTRTCVFPWEPNMWPNQREAGKKYNEDTEWPKAESGTWKAVFVVLTGLDSSIWKWEDATHSILKHTQYWETHGKWNVSRHRHEVVIWKMFNTMEQATRTPISV